MTNSKKQQFIKIIRFIYQSIDKPITLKMLANEAHLSVASLKRLFEDMVGVSPGTFVRRLKMELAFQSLHDNTDSALEVALSTGFEDQSAFTRAFKNFFGYSPRHAKKIINILSELSYIELAEPDIIELNDIKLQAVTEQGNYFESAPRAWQNLQKLLATDELSINLTEIFIGIGHDNPHDGEVARENTRFSACVLEGVNKHNLERLTISGGTYARFYYKGKPNNLGMAYHYIFGHWAEKSEYHLDNAKPSFNCFEQVPEPEQEQVCMIYVPLNQ